MPKNSGKDKKEKKAKKGGSQKDGAKKRGLSGYNLYSKCIRQEVVAAHEGIKVS